MLGGYYKSWFVKDQLLKNPWFFGGSPRTVDFGNPTDLDQILCKIRKFSHLLVGQGNIKISNFPALVPIIAILQEQ